MITKSIERAQKKVEENNFGIRKRLLDYDDVMNRQREVIYGRRRHALFGERLQVDINNSFYDLCEELIADAQKSKDFDGFQLEVIRYFSLDSTITQEELFKNNLQTLTEKLYSEAKELYARKVENTVKTVMPVLQNISDTRGDTVKMVAIPLSDGKKGVNILVDLAETLQNQGKTIVSQFEKSITLALIDEAWKHHLRAMDDLKQEVQLASYEQKDPLVIYKKEAFNLFTAMIGQVNRDIASFLFKAQLPQGDGSSSEQVRNAENEKQKAFAKKIQEGRGSLEEPTLPQGEEQQVPQQAPVQRQEPVRVGPKVGRNDVCPCGSGKKFKNCHGKGMGED